MAAIMKFWVAAAELKLLDPASASNNITKQ